MAWIKVYEPTACSIAKKLLEMGAVQFSDKASFVWSSGQRSPVYCDNRVSLSYPKVRNYIREMLVNVIGKYFDDVEYIAGVATAGIPHGVLVADTLGLPYVYVRSTSKGHGLLNQIEGVVEKGKRIVVVEDLVSTGASLLAVAQRLDASGFDVIGLTSVFTYGFATAKKNIESSGMPLLCLSDFDHLLQVAVQENRLNAHQRDCLEAWRFEHQN